MSSSSAARGVGWGGWELPLTIGEARDGAGGWVRKAGKGQSQERI